MAFYIKSSEGVYFYMDAVVDVNYTQTGSVAKYTLEDSTSSSDHYDQDPDTLSFNGFISRVKFVSKSAESTDFKEYQRGLTVLKKSGQRFTCYYSDTFGEMKDCLFTSLNFSQDTETGNHSVKVSFNIQQVSFAQQAQVEAIPTALAQYTDVVAAKEKGSSTTKKADDKTTSALEDLQESFYGRAFGTQ